jgi:uncharacterized protein (DUF433 family)
MTLALAADPVPLRIDADGVARVVGSRVTLDTIVAAFDEGASPEEIMLRYSSLRLADIYAIITYYLKHKPEVDAYLQERERQAEEVRRQVAERFDQRGLREKLLARRAARDGAAR